jgi:atypical dual specificity phosphatase
VRPTWIVEQKVAAMAMPWPEDVERLPALGFRGVLSLTERVPAGLPAQGLDHLHLPIRDFSPPTQAQLADAVAFMDRVVAAGGGVVVHCGAGLGRTGTVVAAWLVRQGRTSDEAIREVRSRRPGSVETPEQEESVREFARSLGRS